MRSLHRPLAVLALAGVFGALGVVSGGSAQADDAASAGAAAHRSAVKVAKLRAQLAVAVKAYDASLAGVGQQVSAGIEAQDAATDAVQAAQAAQDEQTDRIQALYMSGGQLGVYASLLSAASPTDFALRLQSAESVLSTSGSDVVAAQATADSAVQAQQAADRTTADAVVTADDVSVRAARVAAIVHEAQGVLAHLSSKARSLAEAEQAARDLAAADAAAAGSEAGAVAHAGVIPIPARYVTLYHQAALTCPGMPWTLLAAVGQVESGHGRNDGPSSAGAVGPMQFRPATFAAYAVDGDHDGRTDPWDPADAIFTAAHFLCVGGAGSPAGVQRALLRYNNAQWYVDLVLAVQQHIAMAY